MIHRVTACPMCDELIYVDTNDDHEPNIVYMDGWCHASCVQDQMYGPDEEEWET